MRKLVAFLLMAIACYGFSACSDKKASNNIITSKPKPAKQHTIQSMGDYQQTIPVKWLGNVYDVSVERRSDKDLPLTNDGSGNKFYDNQIILTINRNDKTIFFSKTFTKADFSSYIDANYSKNNALLGIVYDKVEGDFLYFAASIGSPDKLSDEFVPLVLKISNQGAVSISKDSRIDSEDHPQNPNLDEDISEEDGI
ncbi:MAG: DUF4738 domain-containing protein [Prevotella sp.]